MKYLFDCWDKLKEDLASKYMYLFLDYDGTLTPIAESPDKAIISQETKNILETLTKKSRCKLAIISGRALKDIKDMVGIHGIIYVGNHGMEIEGPKIKFRAFISQEVKNIIAKIRDELDKKLSGVKGVFIEDKGLALSIHYRMARKEDRELIGTIFREITTPYLTRKKIKIGQGKMVFEIKPPSEWDKGKITLWLLAREGAYSKDRILPLYIGDDMTDEDAFKVLRNRGLTIFVGKSTGSYAEYYLKDPYDVTKFLKQILIIKEREICQN